MGPPVSGPWSFKYHPWAKEIHDCNSELIVSQKAAQMGFTETALNKCFYTIDILGRDVLYVLPNKSPDATDFSNARFGPALELSEHLGNLFTETDNMGHKRAGNANLYVRGSKSKAGLRSVPVSLIILDEVDVMEQANIPLAMERTSGQMVKQTFMLSTPTIEGTGINLYFNNSTQEDYAFPCPSCSRQIILTQENLKITSDDPNSAEVKNSYLFCTLCNATLDHRDKWRFLAKGYWVKQRDSEVRGFKVSQLYSSALKPYEIAASYLRALTNAFDEQEFYNSKLGVPHSVEGARVTDENINARTGTYRQLLPEDVAGRNRFITLGADVGKFIHVVIQEWFFDSSTFNASAATPKVIAIKKVLNFEDLDTLMSQYQVQLAVVDLNPERRKVREFCGRWPGRAYGCEYVSSVKAREIQTNEAEMSIQVDRTSWLDLTLSRFQRENGVVLPIDMTHEYRQHIKAQTRVYSKDREGNPVARWVTGNVEDHSAHAQNYSEIAFSKAITFASGNTTIGSPGW